MIRYFKRTAKAKLARLDTYKPKSWVYVESPTPQELRQLSEELGLDIGHMNDALDADEMPRMEREEDQLYLFTRYPYETENGELATTPLLLVQHKDFLVTVTIQAFPRLHKFIDSEIEFTTDTPDQLMLTIMQGIVEQFDLYLAQISGKIKAIRSRLRVEKISNRDFVDFVLLEDELNDFLSAMTPANSILRRLLINKHLKLSTRDKELIEDLLLANDQSIESARSSLKSVASISEAYSTIMTNNLNQIIRFLTSLTVILAVPTLIASIYGMNVGLPLAFYEHAFSIIIGGSIVVSLLLFWMFKRKDWL